MMHYKKGKNVEEELSKENIPIENLPENFLWMHVKGGTKIHNVIKYATDAFKNGEYRSVVWSGSGGGVTKTISCAEIMKRDFEMHQVTRINYISVEEYWDPQIDGLEQIVAKRQIPCIHILLTLDDIDPSTKGHQFSKEKTKYWLDHTKKDGHTNRNNYKPGGSGTVTSGNGGKRLRNTNADKKIQSQQSSKNKINKNLDKKS